MYSEALLTGQNLSLGEALAMGGQTTVIGLAIVFAVLIILMIVLSLFKVIFYKKPKTQAAPAAAPKAASAGAGSIKVEAGRRYRRRRAYRSIDSRSCRKSKYFNV